jgi:hypothetical protein
VLKRTYDRAKRGRDLKDWGLRPQPLDQGSSLALDDGDFMAELGGLVNITALFPIMNATDNLAAVADLIEIRPSTKKNAHITSLSVLLGVAGHSFSPYGTSPTSVASAPAAEALAGARGVAEGRVPVVGNHDGGKRFRMR